jgi:hypothetical protein
MKSSQGRAPGLDDRLPIGFPYEGTIVLKVPHGWAAGAVKVTALVPMGV